MGCYGGKMTHGSSWLVRLLKKVKNIKEDKDFAKTKVQDLLNMLKEEKNAIVKKNTTFNGAYYAPGRDTIAIGKAEGFLLYAIVHEIFHWTGAASRLNRPAIVEMQRQTEKLKKDENFKPEIGFHYQMKEELGADTFSLLVCSEIALNGAHNFVNSTWLHYLMFKANGSPLKGKILAQKHKDKKGKEALEHVFRNLKANMLGEAVEDALEAYDYIFKRKFEGKEFLTEKDTLNKW